MFKFVERILGNNIEALVLVVFSEKFKHIYIFFLCSNFCFAYYFFSVMIPETCNNSVRPPYYQMEFKNLMIYKKAIILCQSNYVVSECKRNYFYFAEQIIESKYIWNPIPCKNIRIYWINLPIEISDTA